MSIVQDILLHNFLDRKRHNSFPLRMPYCKRDMLNTIINYVWLFKKIIYWFGPSIVIALHCCFTHINTLSFQVKITRKVFYRASEWHSSIQKTLMVHLLCAKLCFRCRLVKSKINNIVFALRKNLIIYEDGIFHAILMHILSSDFHKYSMD